MIWKNYSQKKCKKSNSFVHPVKIILVGERISFLIIRELLKYNIHVLIGQLVKIIEGGEEVKLSKRAGTIITLEELVEKVGVDAARYTLIRYPVDTPMILDVDVLKRNTNENGLALGFLKFVSASPFSFVFFLHS